MKYYTLPDMQRIAAARVASLGGRAAAAAHYGVTLTPLRYALEGRSRSYALLERIVADALGKPLVRTDRWTPHTGD
jgi:hypothetical protein